MSQRDCPSDSSLPKYCPAKAAAGTKHRRQEEVVMAKAYRLPGKIVIYTTEHTRADRNHSDVKLPMDFYKNRPVLFSLRISTIMRTST